MTFKTGAFTKDVKCIRMLHVYYVLYTLIFPTLDIRPLKQENCFR